jgi:hypothetical protein
MGRGLQAAAHGEYFDEVVLAMAFPTIPRCYNGQSLQQRIIYSNQLKE